MEVRSEENPESSQEKQMQKENFRTDGKKRKKNSKKWSILCLNTMWMNMRQRDSRKWYENMIFSMARIKYPRRTVRDAGMKTMTMYIIIQDVLFLKSTNSF